MNSLFLLNLFMKKILIIGGGAMGSAFSVPCIDNNNKVFITVSSKATTLPNLPSWADVLVIIFPEGYW